MYGPNISDRFSELRGHAFLSGKWFNFAWTLDEKNDVKVTPRPINDYDSRVNDKSNRRLLMPFQETLLQSVIRQLT